MNTTEGTSANAVGGSALIEGLGPTPPLAARLRSACSGYDEWRVQDPKDGSYCIAFNWREVMNPERMAREWLADHCRRFTGGLHTDFVVACVRVQTETDKLMLEAADEIDRLRVGHDRYETARRMSPRQWADAWKLNVSTGKGFDEIVDELRPFLGPNDRVKRVPPLGAPLEQRG